MSQSATLPENFQCLLLDHGVGFRKTEGGSLIAIGNPENLRGEHLSPESGRTWRGVVKYACIHCAAKKLRLCKPAAVWGDWANGMYIPVETKELPDQVYGVT
ncbi:MAG TPA: hypothetical protein VJ455_03610 [Ignavibacteria bacterium]|nr:hypothetical protein [Ignavibacteria bacterium]HLD03747.1 hypothetical protein [Candidatus Dojkabacteria bacterium]